MAVYEDIEDAGVNQFAKGNPVRGGLWIAYGVAWNAFSFGSLEKNSALVEKYKGGKINDRQFNRGVAINTAQASAELAITCAGGSALTGAKTIGSAAVIGAKTGFATAGINVAGNRTEAAVTGQQYKQTVTQDIFQIGTGTVLGAGFGAGAKWFEIFLTHGGNVGNVSPFTPKGQSPAVMENNSWFSPQNMMRRVIGKTRPATARPYEDFTEAPPNCENYLAGYMYDTDQVFINRLHKLFVENDLSKLIRHEYDHAILKNNSLIPFFRHKLGFEGIAGFLDESYACNSWVNGWKGTNRYRFLAEFLGGVITGEAGFYFLTKE
jgi:hypothetical protein